MSTVPATVDGEAGHPRFAVLDGWRAISILFVLAGHLLPLGPKALQLNGAFAATGMVLFFILSGFLITTFLLRRPDVPAFLIRRFCRIVPLAWLYCLIVLGLVGADWPTWAAHLFFYGNLPPYWLIDPTAHLWSLALEMQFYVVAALVVALLGRRGLWVLPVVGLAITAFRVATGTTLSIATYFRADEVMAGCLLALWLHRRDDAAPVRKVPWPLVALLALLLLGSAHDALPWLNYARPYLAAALIGITLLHPGTALAGWLRHRVLAYLAAISFALYVLHIGLGATWLGTGETTLEKYLKRPLLFAALFALAHLSTFHFEKHWIALGKRLTRRGGGRAAEGAA